MSTSSRCKRWAPAALGALLPCAVAWALSVDGHSQIHAVIGQPLAVAVPVSFAGVNPSKVTVRVMPGLDLPAEEEVVAATVQATYDPDRSEVRLSTPQRVLVPALNLHLVVTAGSLVVNQNLEVLVDVPDLAAQHDANAATAVSESQAPGPRALPVEKTAAPSRQFGDSAARGPTPVAVADTAARGPVAAADNVVEAEANAARPTVTPPPPPPPPDPRPKTWQIKPGQTLSGISRSLAAVYHVAPEPMALALYEANSEAFSAKVPEQGIAGRTLQVPEDYVVNSEPADRVTQFRAWQRQPLGAWRLRTFQSLQSAAPAQAGGGAPWWLAQALTTVGGLGVVLLLTSMLLRRIRLRRLVTHYVPMSQVKKVKRIIIPAPPPRRGLSQGAVTEKLRIKRLRELLDHHPFRSDIRYRLAERLHKAGDGRTFAQIAPPLRPSLSPEAWARICKMGQELLPDDPRFQS